MCAPSADDFNARIRALFRQRRGRPLTEPERTQYEQLLAAWTAAERQERGTRLEVVKAA